MATSNPQPPSSPKSPPPMKSSQTRKSAPGTTRTGTRSCAAPAEMGAKKTNSSIMCA
jgi:hypothetical protein